MDKFRPLKKEQKQSSKNKFQKKEQNKPRKKDKTMQNKKRTIPPACANLCRAKRNKFRREDNLKVQKKIMNSFSFKYTRRHRDNARQQTTAFSHALNTVPQSLPWKDFLKTCSYCISNGKNGILVLSFIFQMLETKILSF
jgi:hypothetical protein